MKAGEALCMQESAAADDGGSPNCLDTRQEDAMVLVLNHDDDPLEHGFADVDSNGLQPRKALIMRRPGTRTTQEYERLWAYEFRYDGGRERYLVRKLDRFTLEPDGDTWTDYDVGGSPYGDYTLDGGTPTEQTRYVPGLAQQDVATSAVDYLFGDQIGTLRTMRSGGTPPVTTKRVYTAFGELVEMTGTGQTRYGYAGAWGYQEHDADGAGGPDNILGSPPTGPAIGEVFPFLHVGWRYYDPSTGRFLQRDPIGIGGGLNVYAYADGDPAQETDEEGLDPDKGRGDHPAYGYNKEQMKKAIEDAKKAGDKKLVRELERISKHKGWRNVAKRVGKKGAKLGGKVLPLIGICFFAHDWATGGPLYAVEEAIWPLPTNPEFWRPDDCDPRNSAIMDSCGSLWYW
jgi:RHS repeat-associated protein